MEKKKGNLFFGFGITFTVISIIMLAFYCIPIISTFIASLWQIVILIEIICVLAMGTLLIIFARKSGMRKLFISFGIINFVLALWLFVEVLRFVPLPITILQVLRIISRLIVLLMGIVLISIGFIRKTLDKKQLENNLREQERVLYVEKIKDLPRYETMEVDGGQLQEVPKFKKATMIILIALYSLLLLAGILLVAVPQMQTVISVIGICNEISARAYAISIGLMWIALTPSIGYYFATIPHFEIGKKSAIATAAVTTFLLVSFTVIFLIIINTLEIDGIVIKAYYAIESDSDVWFMPVSMVFGSIGIMICYALTLFRINPEKIKDINSEQNGDGFIHTIVHILMLLVGVVFKIVKGILRLKEKHVNVFIVLATILLTWLIFFTAFVFSLISIAIFITVIILYFAKLVKLADDCSSNSTCLEIHDGGKKIKLEYQPGLVGEDRYETVYKDEYGGTWYSTDGGSTVYKKG